jgi:hypothetical protein
LAGRGRPLDYKTSYFTNFLLGAVAQAMSAPILSRLRSATFEQLRSTRALERPIFPGGLRRRPEEPAQRSRACIAERSPLDRVSNDGLER